MCTPANYPQRIFYCFLRTECAQRGHHSHHVSANKLQEHIYNIADKRIVRTRPQKISAMRRERYDKQGGIRNGNKQENTVHLRPKGNSFRQQGTEIQDSAIQDATMETYFRHHILKHCNNSTVAGVPYYGHSNKDGKQGSGTVQVEKSGYQLHHIRFPEIPQYVYRRQRATQGT